MEGQLTENNNEKEILTCAICGENNDDVFHKTKCGHIFHYNCLYLSFKHLQNNICPYCRSTKNVLPIITGLKKITPSIHFNSSNIIETNDILSNHHVLMQKCKHEISRGKNKGDMCGRNCKLGYEFCGIHYKKHIKNGEQIIM